MAGLIINLLGGPGVGKSTIASGLFYKAKKDGQLCELIHEVAKDLTYEKRYTALSCQPFVFGKQLMKSWRLMDESEYIITDSPILLSCIYGAEWGSDFVKSCLDIFNTFNNANFLLKRKKAYVQVGRNQNEAEAREIDSKVEEFLVDNGIPHIIIEGQGDAAVDEIFDLVFDRQIFSTQT